MNSQQMLDMLRTLTATDSNTLPDATGLSFLNFSYKKRIARWKQDVNEDFWTDFFQTNTVPYQSEYPLPLSTGANNGVSSVIAVAINYAIPTTGTGTISGTSGQTTVTGSGTSFTTLVGKTLDTGSYRGVIVAAASDTSCTVDTVIGTTFTSVSFNYYTDNWVKATQFRLGNAERDESWYRANQPSQNAMWSFYDDSVFIYPYHNKSVTNGVKIYAVRDPDDLVLSPSPTTPILDADFHYSIIIGAKKWVYQMRGMIPEYQVASNEADKDLDELTHIQSERNLSPVSKVVPDYTQFQ
jgi:hypothetical protein